VRGGKREAGNEKSMENSTSAVEIKRKKLLLHICCAPCSTSVIPRLSSEYEVCGFFYNPNIDIEEEYILRKSEIEKLAKIYNTPMIYGEYDVEKWRELIKGLEKEPEGGKRCEVCFRKRLKETAEVAKEKGFDLFCTTLTVSPLKNAKLINQTGKEIEKETGCKYLESNFKKKDGFKKSVELSRKYNLYRQNYCGCSYSKRGLEVRVSKNLEISGY